MKFCYKKFSFFSSLALVLITSWNGSLSDSSNKPPRPDTNFYGTIQDHSGKILNVEDIVINKKYNSIPVYQVPATNTLNHSSCSCSSSSASSDATKKDMDPRLNKILLDLDEVSSISLAHPHKPVEHEKTINNAKYSEINVTSINGTMQNFLMESSREISCVVIDKGPDNNAKPILQERKIAIIQLKELIIKGKKSAHDTDVSRVRKDEQDSNKVTIEKETEKILDEIEKNVNTLSKEPSSYEKFTTKMASLLRSLRDQLQKMLNLIKG